MAVRVAIITDLIPGSRFSFMTLRLCERVLFFHGASSDTALEIYTKYQFENTMAELDLEQIANDLVDKATAAGASAADMVVLEGEEFSTTLRLGKIEKLKEASSKGLGLRVFIGTQSRFLLFQRFFSVVA